MAANVTFKYKVQKPDFEQRKLEGERTMKNHPSKVPVCIVALAHLVSNQSFIDLY